MSSVYAVLYKNNFGSYATASDVLNGLNPDGETAEWSGQVAAGTESGTFDWSSLISSVVFEPGTFYVISMVWTDGAQVSNVSHSTPFTYYIYPNPSDVKFGVTYGPSGSEFTGSFIFGLSFDLMTGDFVSPSTYNILDQNIQSGLISLTPDLVRSGVNFGTNSVGQSNGYLSYDVNTGRIARPLSNKALIVV